MGGSNNAGNVDKITARRIEVLSTLSAPYPFIKQKNETGEALNATSLFRFTFISTRAGTIFESRH